LKDRDKALGVVPYAANYWSKRDALLKRGIAAGELEQFYWMTEELRLAVFAPELGPTVPVSEKRLKETWAWLTRP
jgi:ATP-dependent helicase HrpA